VKASRKHYDELLGMSDGEQLARVKSLKGAELAALMHYALGREAGERRDAVLSLVLAVAGQRYLTKQAAKARKTAKRIL
jgi:hypothetical protein